METREVGMREGEGHGVREGGAEESEEEKVEGRGVEGEGLGKWFWIMDKG